jgi:hypothetical protein
MPELIVTEKIDGTAIAWRCSDCRQSFSVRGKLTTQDRRRKITAEFKAHLEERHIGERIAGDMTPSLAQR